MKNLIKTAVIGIALTASVASCSKSETTSNNNSQTQLSANQMLLLGTTNPNDANASALWELDSSYRYNTQTYDTLDHTWFLFTVDSMINCTSDGTPLYSRHSYSIGNDSMYVNGVLFGILTISPTNFVADMGVDVGIKHYFTKVN